MNFNTENYLRLLEEAVDEMRENKDLESQYLQMDNTRYHWTTEALEFIEKDIKRFIAILTRFKPNREYLGNNEAEAWRKKVCNNDQLKIRTIQHLGNSRRRISKKDMY